MLRRGPDTLTHLNTKRGKRSGYTVGDDDDGDYDDSGDMTMKVMFTRGLFICAAAYLSESIRQSLVKKLSAIFVSFNYPRT